MHAFCPAQYHREWMVVVGALFLLKSDRFIRSINVGSHLSLCLPQS